jgi:pyruvate dehydrogenase E2 component (dihydrolipoamide acetyltransferase)
MAFEVVMPRLGWNMEEGTLAGWRKNDGDQVAVGDILFEVESDKALQEVEALENGTLRIPAGSPEKGATVPVGTLLAWLVAPGESIPNGAPSPAAAPAPAAPGPRTAPVAAPEVKAERGTPREGAPSRQPAQRPEGARRTAGAMGAPAAGARHPAISPRAKRVARELGVDWSGLVGSGSTGRIVERDIRSATSVRAAAPGAAASAAMTLTTEVDATEVVRLRNMFKAQGADIVPSYDDILVRIAALALQEHPDCNVRFQGQSIVAAEGASVGIAVDTDRGVLTPVIRDAQEKTLKVIAQESARLIEEARTGGVSPDGLRGGTLTLTNLGMFEIDAFTPVLDGAECAILGVGRIRAQQVVMDADKGVLAIRQMAVLSLTFDHRLMRGVPAARLLQTIKRYIEKPYLWLAGT